MINTVGLADMKISSAKEDIIITHGLGSCLGVTVYDPLSHVGGMIHIMLPLSSINPENAKTRPYMFVDTGIPKLFIKCYELGACKERMIVTVAGGSNPLGANGSDFFNIGERNFDILKRLLEKNNIPLRAYDVGGTQSRTMSINIETGTVNLKLNGYEKKVLYDGHGEQKLTQEL